MFNSKSRKAIAFLVLAILFFAIPEIYNFQVNGNPQDKVNQAASNLKALSDKLKVSLADISTLKTENELHAEVLHGGYDKQGYSFYGLKNHQVFFWSGNDAGLSGDVLDTIHPSSRIALGNGDYMVDVVENNGSRWIGILLIHRNYPYENRYLQNEFNPAIIESAVIDENGLALHLPDGSVGYKVSVNTEQKTWITNFYWLSILFLLLSIYFFLIGKSILYSIGGGLFLFALRFLMIRFQIPDDLYILTIFSPQYYASAFLFNSPGDLIINCFVFLLIAILIYQNLNEKAPSTLFKIIFGVCWILSAIGIHTLLHGLVINSQISFDVSNPASIDFYSVLAFTVTAVLLIAFLFLTAAFFGQFSKQNLLQRYGGLALVVLAGYAAFTLQFYYQKKEIENRKIVAKKADARQDHVAEYLFDEAEQKIYTDPEVISLLRNHHLKEDISTYIIQKYFTGYFSRFDIAAFVFYNSNPTKSDSATLQEIRNRIAIGKPTTAKDLFFISNDAGGGAYMAELPFDELNASIAITMDARFFQSEEGFPELFISGRFRENFSNGEYSIAHYRNNNLVYEFGNYVYSLSPKEFSASNEEYTLVSFNGYDHLLYRTNSDSLLVVSKPKIGIISLLTLFSWTFTVMLIVSFFVYVFSFLIHNDFLPGRNLTARIQTSVLFLVVLSFVLIGAGTTIYINRKYANDQKKSIGDQVNALWFRVSELNLIPDSLSTDQLIQLDRLSGNTNINFNLFDAGGKLIYSSQPKIYENGILAPLMNPEAYFEIQEKGITQFIHPENAGKLKYISAYAPVLGNDGKMRAFLNLPYFEKQNELNKEISGFLSALLNIYVLLFALAVLITVFISTRITKPLLLIQQKMSGVKFGSANEQIEYSGNDEIGRLVKEYNRMLEQLALSAEKLAQSERESAWREMARQVAHEIKNPLTPMKLAIQHLQRTNKEKGQADPEMVNRISDNLIQQIDTLANIATAFSDFAKLPQTNEVRVDVAEVLKQLVALYSEMPDIEISFTDISTDAVISADKDQLNRIFSNILKNAVQAIPENRHGRIAVRLSNDNGFLRVDIEDNGIGIPEDQQEKIFKPNFTTKSGGMGLGLAMVRNMVHAFNGTISFSSTYNSGTTFTIRLPKIG